MISIQHRQLLHCPRNISDKDGRSYFCLQQTDCVTIVTKSNFLLPSRVCPESSENEVIPCSKCLKNSFLYGTSKTLNFYNTIRHYTINKSQWSRNFCRDTNKDIIAAILPFRAWVKNKNHYNFRYPNAE